MAGGSRQDGQVGPGGPLSWRRRAPNTAAAGSGNTPATTRARTHNQPLANPSAPRLQHTHTAATADVSSKACTHPGGPAPPLNPSSNPRRRRQQQVTATRQQGRPLSHVYHRPGKWNHHSNAVYHPAAPGLQTPACARAGQRTTKGSKAHPSNRIQRRGDPLPRRWQTAGQRPVGAKHRSWRYTRAAMNASMAVNANVRAGGHGCTGRSQRRVVGGARSQTWRVWRGARQQQRAVGCERGMGVRPHKAQKLPRRCRPHHKRNGVRACCRRCCRCCCCCCRMFLACLGAACKPRQQPQHHQATQDASRGQQRPAFNSTVQAMTGAGHTRHAAAHLLSWDLA
jgi:hypothetical protein